MGRRVSQFFRAILVGAIVLVGCSDRTPADVALLDYGIYDATLLTKGSTELDQQPEIVSVYKLTHRETTASIPREAGTYFGMRLNPGTFPSRYHLRVEYEHPPFTEPGKEAPTTLSAHEYEITSRDENDAVVMWYFLDGAEYEMVAGTWTFRVYVNKQLVAERAFLVGP